MNYDLKQHLKEEWAFYKRHPELILVWIVFLISVIYAFTSDEATR